MLVVELQPSEQLLGHLVLASELVSQALGLSSLRQESPLLSIPPAMHLRASLLPVNSLPLIEFSLLFILLSALYPSHWYPPLHPLSWAHLLPSLYCCHHQHFFRGVCVCGGGISESKHFLHIKMWNSFWHWARNRVEPAICPYLFFYFPSLLPSPLSFPYSVFLFNYPQTNSPTLLSFIT